VRELHRARNRLGVERMIGTGIFNEVYIGANFFQPRDVNRGMGRPAPSRGRSRIGFALTMMSVWSTIIETWRATPAPIQSFILAAFGLVIGAWLTSRAQANAPF
jgi:hypothetical protein